MVTAPHHLATQAGIAVLRDGGNAVEAVVAAAATIAVVYPHMNGIGGDGFWLISEPGKPPWGIDACGRAAALATPEYYTDRQHKTIPSRGPDAANTVAGAVSGWKTALAATASRLPLGRLLEDAIVYAREGAPVTQSQVDYTRRFAAELVPQPGFAKTFLRDGKMLRAGVRQRFPALAATLERLAKHGLDDFYRGDIANSLACELGRLGSPLRRDDLERHAASVVLPLSTELSVGTVFNLPSPTQGLASLMILAIFDRIRGRTRADTFEHVHGLVEATKQAFLVRNRHICDPGTMRVGAVDFLAEASLAELTHAIDAERARPWPEPAVNGDTVWMGAADHYGCIVSYIQSIYWEFGSAVTLVDTGVTWQNRGSSFSLDPSSHLLLASGRKPFHTLNPALAQLSDGRTMVYGTMGGDGQPQSQAAIFSRYAMFDQDLQQAITAPRWLLGRTWGEMSVSLKLESRFDPTLVQALRQAGHDIEMLDAFSESVGHAGALVVHPDRTISGAADPRSDGAVAGY